MIFEDAEIHFGGQFAVFFCGVRVNSAGEIYFRRVVGKIHGDFGFFKVASGAEHPQFIGQPAEIFTGKQQIFPASGKKVFITFFSVKVEMCIKQLHTALHPVMCDFYRSGNDECHRRCQTAEHRIKSSAFAEHQEKLGDNDVDHDQSDRRNDRQHTARALVACGKRDTEEHRQKT